MDGYDPLSLIPQRIFSRPSPNAEITSRTKHFEQNIVSHLHNRYAVVGL